MRIARHYTTDDGSPREEITYRTTACEIRNPDGLGGVRAGGRRGSGRLVAGRLRRACPEIFPQGRHRRPGASACPRTTFPNGCGGACRTRTPPPPTPTPPATKTTRPPAASVRRRRCFTASPAPGPTGAGRPAISTPSRTPAPSMTSSAPCWRCRWRRPTRRNGSNTGLHWAYGIDGPAQGHYFVDHESGEVNEATSAYERPQPHACFIQSIADDLVNEGGIMDLWVREARLFKYGSGTGTNFSNLRGEGEALSGGGKSSGLMSSPQDRRPRRRRHQVRRHHAARRQDGHRRRGPPGYRGLRLVEGGRGAEGRGPGVRVGAAAHPPQRESSPPAAKAAAPAASMRRPMRPSPARCARRARRWFRRPASTARSVGPNRVLPKSTSASTTRTGSPRPTSPHPARTPTTRSA